MLQQVAIKEARRGIKNTGRKKRNGKNAKKIKGVTPPVNQFFSQYQTLKNKAEVFDEAAKSHVGCYNYPNPAQLNQEKKEILVAPEWHYCDNLLDERDDLMRVRLNLFYID